jgi:hypothetical protein
MKGSKLIQSQENGKLISPVFPDSVINYLIDIDGTITEDVPNEDPERMKIVLPFPDAVETIRKWYSEGHVITFFTSRTEDLRKITEDWVSEHQIPFHFLVMGKPRGGNYVWIDNHIVRGVRYKGIWGDLQPVEKTVRIFPEN